MSKLVLPTAEQAADWLMGDTDHPEHNWFRDAFWEGFAREFNRQIYESFADADSQWG